MPGSNRRPPACKASPSPLAKPFLASRAKTDPLEPAQLRPGQVATGIQLARGRPGRTRSEAFGRVPGGKRLGSDTYESPQAATLADHQRLRDRPQARQRSLRKLTQLVLEVVDQIEAARVMRADVVMICVFVGQSSCVDGHRLAASALANKGRPSISQISSRSSSTRGSGRMTCRSRMIPPGRTALIMLRRTFTTSLGSTQSPGPSDAIRKGMTAIELA